jgi:vacuolar-type H+-ATPase subunit I/STV1
MEMYRLTIQKDDAWKVTEMLGNLDVAHLIDLNKGEQSFNLPYSNRIRLCDETERRLLYLIGKCKEHRLRVNKPEDAEAFSENINQVSREKKKAIHLLYDAIENDVAEKEKFVSSQVKAITEMKAEVGKLQDYLEVLKYVDQMIPRLGSAMPARGSQQVDQEISHDVD